MLEWGVSIEEAILPVEAEAAAMLYDSLGFDPIVQPAFWEHVMARYLGGVVTDHGEECDVHIDIDGHTLRAEVKFSQSYYGSFRQVSGTRADRRVFKWARPRGFGGKDSADAILLIGLDEGHLFAWVIPTADIKRGCKSITMTTPRARTGSRSRWDGYAVPFDAILGAFSRICCRREAMDL